IRKLLGLDAQNGKTTVSDNLQSVGSPEMYFGTERLQYLTPSQQPSSVAQSYTLNQNVALNNFSLGGTWQFSSQLAELSSGTGQINLKFHSGKLFMVAASQKPATLTITVDGKKQPSVTVQASQLYT